MLTGPVVPAPVSVALPATVTAEEIEPLICNPPPKTEVAPVYVFRPLTVSVPLPILLSVSTAMPSLMTPAKVPLPVAQVCLVLIGILLGAVVTPATLRGMATWPLNGSPT